MINDFEIYKMKLQVLTPLFIGSGEDYDRCDYIYDKENKRIHIIKQDKWIKYLSKSKKSLLEKFLEDLEDKGKMLEIDSWLESNGESLSEVIKNCCSGNIFNIPEIDDFKLNTVHSFIKNSDGEPYIPGSSIKGAIVSALIGYYVDKKKLKNEKIKINGILVSDSETFKLEDLKLYKKKDKIINDKKDEEQELPIYRECIIPKTEVEFTIGIDKKLIKKSGLDGFNGIDTIYEALKHKFNALYDDNQGIYHKCDYEKILKYMPADIYNDENHIDKGVLVLGGGAGFHSKSIVSSIYDFDKAINETKYSLKKGIAKKHKHQNDTIICPRAIKLSDTSEGLRYMGFCKIFEQ